MVCIPVIIGGARKCVRRGGILIRCDNNKLYFKCNIPLAVLGTIHIAPERGV